MRGSTNSESIRVTITLLHYQTEVEESDGWLNFVMTMATEENFQQE